MKASEFYKFGQQLSGALSSQFPDMFGKPETKETPEKPEQPQRDQPPQVDRSSPKYPEGRQEQSPSRGQSNGNGRGLMPNRETMDPSYAGSGDFKLSNEFAYDERIVDQIVQKYVGQGYDPRYAVGMAANAIVESNLVPTAYNENEDAFGIAQWRHDRLEGLRDYADRMGKSANDIDAQISFSLEELRTTEQSAHNRIIKADPETAADYARLIDKHYERSDGKARERRASIASQLWRDYYGKGGRADSPMLSYNEDTVPLQRNAQTRDEYVAQMAQDDPDGVDMGAVLEARQASAEGMSREDAIQNPAVDYMVGQSMERSEPVQGAPTTAELSGEQTPQTSTQSPSGGQTELGQSADAAGTGEMREGFAGGLQDIFGRREEESDDSFRDRRRNMFLNAAEGFQMLSRGVKADFTSPTQQRLNEAQRRIDNSFRDTEQVRQQSNADRQYGLQQAQEARLQRAQALEEQKLVMGQAATMAEREQDQQTMQSTAELMRESGYEDLAKLAEAGQLQTATDLYSSREEARIPNNDDLLKYRMSEPTIEGGAIRAESIGRPELAEQIRDSNPKVAYEALQTLNDMDANEGAAQNISWADDEVYQGYLQTIPENLSPTQKQNARALARSARLEDDATTRDTLLERMVEIGSTSGIDSTVAGGIGESIIEEYNRVVGPGEDLYEAGLNTMSIAANPDFNPNQLKGTVITPFARYLRGLGEPGKKLAEELFNVSSADAFAQALLESISSGQLGNLAQGVTGQLSNLEGQRLLKQIGGGSNERAEIMALGQLLAAGVQKDIAGVQAKKDYVAEIQQQGGSFDFQEMSSRVRRARRADDVFPRVSEGMDGLADMQEQAITDWMERTGSSEPESFNALPPEIRGMVVRYIKPKGGEEYLPLFANKFDEYQPEIDEYIRSQRGN